MNLWTVLIFAALVAGAQPLHFEGVVPPDVDMAAMNTEYYRIYRIVAPRKRPDRTPLRIVYFSHGSPENFDRALPEWGGGGTIGGNLIVIPTSAKPFMEQSFAQVTRHELVHAVLARAYPSLYIPRWFHEGLAMTLSGEISLQENVDISKAIFTNRLMPLSSIDSVNDFGRNRADLAYSQSHLAVLFLIGHYGIDVIPGILGSAERTGSFWNGVSAELSLDPAEFELLARKDLTARYEFVFLFADSYAFWIAVVVLFLIAFAVTAVRKQQKLALMAQEEKEGEARRTLEDVSADATQVPPEADSPPRENAGDPPVDKVDINEDGRENERAAHDDSILADGVDLEDEYDGPGENGGGEENRNNNTR